MLGTRKRRRLRDAAPGGGHHRPPKCCSVSIIAGSIAPKSAVVPNSISSSTCPIVNGSVIIFLDEQYTVKEPLLRVLVSCPGRVEIKPAQAGQAGDRRRGQGSALHHRRREDQGRHAHRRVPRPRRQVSVDKRQQAPTSDCSLRKGRLRAAFAILATSFPDER